MITATVAGRIGKDAETRTAGAGTVTSFSVAADIRENREKRTIWFDVNIWGQRGEKVAQYIRKGEAITVTGAFSDREHNGKTYYKLDCHDFQLQGGGSQGGGSSNPQGSGAPAGGDPFSDDIPFNAEGRA